MLRHAVLVALALVVVTAAVPAPARAAETDILRIPAIFPYDAQTIDTWWFEAGVEYRKTDDTPGSPKSSDLLVKALAAFSPIPELEVGATISHISRDFDRDALGSPSGPSDALAWGKYRFHREQETMFTVGAFASLPTGDEDDGLGNGNIDPGVFLAAGTRTAGNAFVEASLGLRVNGDLDSRFARADGKTSVLVDIGAVIPASQGFDAFAAFALETERYDGGDSFAQVSGGGRWQISGPWRLQAQAGLGLGDAAPKVSLGVSVVYAP